jgi:uncharacterized repeat protein (TIGR01451 family)
MIMEFFMQPVTSLSAKARAKRLRHGLGVSALTLALFASQSGPAFATIDNTATANGTPASGTLTAPSDSESVTVAPAGPQLTIVSTVIDAPNATTVTDGADPDSIVAGGDTITIRYTIQNTGNVSINTVTPSSPTTTFNLVNGTATLSGYTLVSTSDTVNSTGATLLPGESGIWTATYTMSAIDTYRAAGIVAATGDALIHTTSATGSPVTGPTPALNVVVIDNTAETQIPSNPAMTIVKSHSFTTDTGTTGEADVGDVIRYRYEVTNTGNVTITGVTIADVHEGTPVQTLPTRLVAQETIAAASGGYDGPLAPTLTSTTGTANDGTWATLRPGARVIFFYDHTVNQTEFNSQ